MLRFLIASSLLLAAGFSPQMATAADADIEDMLIKGQLAKAERLLQARVDAAKEDAKPEDAFQLGIVQSLRAFEDLAKSQYRYGLFNQRRIRTVFTQLPAAPNDSPDPISYKDARAIVERFEKNLEKAEATLAGIQTDSDAAKAMKVPFRIGLIRMDLNGDGEATESETLWRVYQAMSRTRINQETASKFQMNLDIADVVWLRGYCNVLLATCDMTLAYDWQEIFERYGHRIYPNVETPHTFFEREARPDPNNRTWWGDSRDIADLIAFIHLVNFPLEEADRMKQAHTHLLKVIELSRVNWKLIQAETDDDLEWVPNANQKTVLPGGEVTQEMITGWHAFLDEAELVLTGKRLIPFWRGHKKDYFSLVFWGSRTLKAEDWAEINKAPGVNLKKVFTEPKSFDMVMWITGTGATPFLEEGPKTNVATWADLNRRFRGQLFGFALWVN